MRAVFVIVGAVCSGFLSVFGQNINEIKNMPKYDSRYDYLDIDAILDSKRLVRNYVDCLVNIKPCTPEGKALKRILPEALRTKCARCTERQKKTAVKVIRRLKYEYPEDWAKLSSRWDPTGDFTRFFEEFLTKDQSNAISSGGDEVAVSATMSPRPFPQRSTPPTDNVTPSTGGGPVASPSSSPDMTMTPTPQPVFLNRFGEEGDMSGTPSSMTPMATNTDRPASMRPSMQTRPSEPIPTRFPLRPPTPDMPPPYSTAITIIDQIGFKIMRTTELVTDILKNTVRAVVSG